MTDFPEKKNITIFGGGNGAHVLAGISSMVKNAHMTVVDTYEDEAERWTKAMAENGFTVKFNGGKQLSQQAGAVKFSVTKQVEEIVRKADIVILCMPAFLHEMILTKIAAFLQDNCVVVGLPGQAGFEYQALAIMKENGKTCSIVSIETLPWACRIAKYGQEVEVMGTKEEIYASQVEQTKREVRDMSCSPMDQVQTILAKSRCSSEKQISSSIHFFTDQPFTHH